MVTVITQITPIDEQAWETRNFRTVFRAAKLRVDSPKYWILIMLVYSKSGLQNWPWAAWVRNFYCHLRRPHWLVIVLSPHADPLPFSGSNIRMVKNLYVKRDHNICFSAAWGSNDISEVDDSQVFGFVAWRRWHVRRSTPVISQIPIHRHPHVGESHDGSGVVRHLYLGLQWSRLGDSHFQHKFQWATGILEVHGSRYVKPIFCGALKIMRRISNLDERTFSIHVSCSIKRTSEALRLEWQL